VTGSSPFNRQAGQGCPIMCTSFSSERKTTVLQWVFKLNSVPSTEETWQGIRCCANIYCSGHRT